MYSIDNLAVILRGQALPHRDRLSITMQDDLAHLKVDLLNLMVDQLNHMEDLAPTVMSHRSDHNQNYQFSRYLMYLIYPSSSSL